MKTQTATFALGCFWHAQEEFDKVKGIISTRVGYSGGRTKNPSYEEVSSGKTGHAETIEIKFNPEEISYEKFLKIFWKIHDPTTLNRQGPDAGTQYRSIIFYHNAEQKKLAEKSLKEEQKNHKDKIVTEIIPASDFYEAEGYHQKYYLK
jgi:peptide-methionine (S)-S-oxide reductase